MPPLAPWLSTKLDNSTVRPGVFCCSCPPPRTILLAASSSPAVGGLTSFSVAATLSRRLRSLHAPGSWATVQFSIRMCKIDFRGPNAPFGARSRRVVERTASKPLCSNSTLGGVLREVPLRLCCCGSCRRALHCVKKQESPKNDGTADRASAQRVPGRVGCSSPSRAMACSLRYLFVSREAVPQAAHHFYRTRSASGHSEESYMEGPAMFSLRGSASSVCA